MITTYKVKLPSKPTVKDLIKFFSAIPAKEWCVDELQNKKGQRCAYGHLGAAFGGDAISGDLPYGLPRGLVDANNGFQVADRTKSIKSRVLRYLESLVK